jgi:aconitate hydratase
VTSPELVMAYALAGTLDFNPLRDDVDGVRLEAPLGEELPEAGFESGEAGFLAPPEDGSGVEVSVRPDSDRLQLLEPFPPWDGNDFVELPVLVKAKGKCTTDHISPAGRWLRYRGHLENISGNLFSGAVDAYTGEAGHGRCPLHGEIEPYPEIAKHLKDKGLEWVAIGDENYGEGSSREHAAMEIRFMGGRVILARSFARIAETNLKKQGVLPLWFADPASYDAVHEGDRVSVLGLSDLTPDTPVPVRVHHSDDTATDVECTHTLSEEHIAWFKAGSALNIIRQQQRQS